MSFKRITFLVYALFAYVLLQFFWWAYLIYKSNGADQKTFYMVLGEGAVFLCLLLGGFYFVLKHIGMMRAKQEMQDDFLLSVTHELKTPITSVRLAMQSLNTDLNKAQKQTLTEISIAQIDHMNRMVDNVLNSSKLSSNQYSIELQSININTLIDSVCKELDVLYEHVEVVKKGFNQTIIQADAFALRSIIYNLLENAYKYTADGKVLLHLSDKVLKVSNKSNQVIQTDKVFDKFHKTSINQKGLGLGLYLAKRFSDVMDFRLFAEQKTGLVTFTLSYTKP